MNDFAPHVALHPRTDGKADGPVPGRAYQELWFSISRKPWTSLVLVPVDPGRSASTVAKLTAEVANRLAGTPVTAVTADKLDFDSACLLADMQRHTSIERQRGPVVETTVWPAQEYLAEPGSPAGEGAPEKDLARALPTSGRLIVEVPSVIDEPLGVAVAQAAGTVVLCIEMGWTRLADVKKTVDLIGRELIAGCFLFRDG